ncbi:zinc ribbon domain-containing protein [Nonomuraea wenchangensis]|uniref:zinc ribbon domain-containing protein n=1 Tax=Nonomuraea wenchangensis TaxID=568860 RepID=UPI003CCC2FE9
MRWQSQFGAHPVEDGRERFRPLDAHQLLGDLPGVAHLWVGQGLLTPPEPRPAAELAQLDGLLIGDGLAGLLKCGFCGRRLDSHWVNGRPGYRCRHGCTSARPREASGPEFLYIREDRLLAELLAHVGGRGREGPMEIVSA